MVTQWKWILLWLIQSRNRRQRSHQVSECDVFRTTIHPPSPPADWQPYLQCKCALIKQIMHFTCPASLSVRGRSRVSSKAFPRSPEYQKSNMYLHLFDTLWKAYQMEFLRVHSNSISGKSGAYMWPEHVSIQLALSSLALDDGTVQMNIKPD